MFIKRLKTLYLPRERCGVLQYVDIAVLHVTRFRFSKTSFVSLFAYKEFTFIKTSNMSYFNKKYHISIRPISITNMDTTIVH